MSQFGYHATLFTAVPDHQLRRAGDARSRRRDVHARPTSRARRPNNLNDASALYALLTGRVTAINGNARLEREQPVRVHRPHERRPEPERVRHLRPGLLARDADPHAERRRAVGGAAPVVALNGNYSTATWRTSAGHRGFGNGPGGRDATCFSPASSTRAGMTPQYAQHKANRAGLQDRLEQLRAERERGVAAERARPASCGAPGRSRTGDDSRRLLDRLQPQRHGRVPEHLRRQSRPIDQRQPHQRPRQPRAGWRHLAVALRETGPARPAGAVHGAGHRPAASRRRQLSARWRRSTTASTSSIPTSSSRTRSRTRSAFSARSRATWRSKSATSATRTTGGWTTENWNEVNIYENGFLDEFKLAQANLASHVAAGCGADGQSACSFGIAVRAPARQPLPIYLAHFNAADAGQAGDAGALQRERQLHEHDVCRPSESARARARQRRPTTCSTARRSAPTCWPPACRRTSGS